MNLVNLVLKDVVNPETVETMNLVNLVLKDVVNPEIAGEIRVRDLDFRVLGPVPVVLRVAVHGHPDLLDRPPLLRPRLVDCMKVTE
jgi:hypothetical protein